MLVSWAVNIPLERFRSFYTCKYCRSKACKDAVFLKFWGWSHCPGLELELLTRCAWWAKRQNIFQISNLQVIKLQESCKKDLNLLKNILLAHKTESILKIKSFSLKETSFSYCSLMDDLLQLWKWFPLLRLADLHYRLQAFQSKLMNCSSNDLQFKILVAIVCPKNST